MYQIGIRNHGYIKYWINQSSIGKATSLLSSSSSCSSYQRIYYSQNRQDQPASPLSIESTLGLLFNKYHFNPTQINVNDIYINFKDKQSLLVDRFRKDKEMVNILNDRLVMIKRDKLLNDSKYDAQQQDTTYYTNLINQFKHYGIKEMNNQQQQHEQRQILNNQLLWCQQYLPNAIEINGDSINSIATQCFNHIYPILYLMSSSLNDQFGGDFKYLFHSIAYSNDDSILTGRCQLIETSIMEKIKNTRKKLFNSRILTVQQQEEKDNNNIKQVKGKEEETIQEQSKEEPIVIQLLLVSNSKAYISISKSNYSNEIGWLQPLPFKMGVVDIERDKAPPSRAYVKLEESLSLLGRIPHPKSRCLELGSAPGGWTIKLLSLYNQNINNNPINNQDNNQIKLSNKQKQQQKKQQHLLNQSNIIELTSVDRSPLEPWITQQYKPPHLEHLIENGMKWRPSKPYQWLFNDMLVDPLKSIDVLDSYLSLHLVQDTFVWTLKFVSQSIPMYQQVLDKINHVMKKPDNRIDQYIIRHLANHGNELTIFGKINQNHQNIDTSNNNNKDKDKNLS